MELTPGRNRRDKKLDPTPSALSGVLNEEGEEIMYIPNKVIFSPPPSPGPLDPGGGLTMYGPTKKNEGKTKYKGWCGRPRPRKMPSWLSKIEREGDLGWAPTPKRIQGPELGQILDDPVSMGGDQESWTFLSHWANLCEVLGYDPVGGTESRPRCPKRGAQNVVIFSCWPPELCLKSSTGSGPPKQITVMNPKGETTARKGREDEAGVSLHNDRLYSITGEVSIPHGKDQIELAAGKEILVDTGARVQAINSGVFESMCQRNNFLLDEISPPSYELMGADGTALRTRGMVELTLQVGRYRSPECFYITDGLPCGFLVGSGWLDKAKAQIDCGNSRVTLDPKGAMGCQVPLNRLGSGELGKGLVQLVAQGRPRRTRKMWTYEDKPAQVGLLPTQQKGRARWVPARSQVEIWMRIMDGHLYNREDTIVPRFIGAPIEGISLLERPVHHAIGGWIPVVITNQTDRKINCDMLNLGATIYPPGEDLSEDEKQRLKVYPSRGHLQEALKGGEPASDRAQGECRCTPKTVFLVAPGDQHSCDPCQAQKVIQSKERSAPPENHPLTLRKGRGGQGVKRRQTEHKTLLEIYAAIKQGLLLRLVRTSLRAPGKREQDLYAKNMEDRIRRVTWWCSKVSLTPIILNYNLVSSSLLINN